MCEEWRTVAAGDFGPGRAGPRPHRAVGARVGRRWLRVGGQWLRVGGQWFRTVQVRSRAGSFPVAR